MLKLLNFRFTSSLDDVEVNYDFKEEFISHYLSLSPLKKKTMKKKTYVCVLDLPQIRVNSFQLERTCNKKKTDDLELFF